MLFRSAYDCHSFGIKADGTVWSWGWVSYAGMWVELCGGWQPTQFVDITGVVAADAGNEHMIALKADGSVWTWGENSYGQLGDGTTTSRYAPVLVGALAPEEGIPVDPISDELPAWIDEELTELSYISEEERPAQGAIDDIFDFIADKIGDSPAVTFDGPVKDAIIAALYNPPVVGIPDDDVHNISVVASQDMVYIFSVVEGMDYIVSYSSTGSVSKTFTYTDTSGSYVVSNIDNECLYKIDVSQHTDVIVRTEEELAEIQADLEAVPNYADNYPQQMNPMVLSDAEHDEFMQDLLNGLVPLGKQIYTINEVREYLFSKYNIDGGDGPGLQMFATQLELSVAQVTSIPQTILVDFTSLFPIFVEMRTAEKIATQVSSPIPGLGKYTINGLDTIPVNIYDTQFATIRTVGDQIFDIIMDNIPATVASIAAGLAFPPAGIAKILSEVSSYITDAGGIVKEIKAIHGNHYSVTYLREGSTYDHTYTLGQVELPQAVGIDELRRVVDTRTTESLPQTYKWEWDGFDYPFGNEVWHYANYVARYYYDHCERYGQWIYGANEWYGLEFGNRFPEHQHQYFQWASHNQYQHKRICANNICVEYKNHDYTHPCDTRCETCGYTDAARGHKMDTIWYNYLEDGEKRGCTKNGCDYIETRSHNLAQGFWRGGMPTCDFAGEWVEACQTCHYEKKTVQGALGHDFGSATCTSPQKCSRCPATQGSALGHNYQWQTISTGNCSTLGTEQQVCSHNSSHRGSTRSTSLNTNVHSYQWQTISTGNCSTSGTEQEVCSHNNSHRGSTRSTSLNTNVHNYQWQTISTGNCSTTGTEQQVCSYNSSHKGSTQNTSLNTNVHSYQWKTVAAATCYSAGTEQQICSHNSNHKGSTRSIPKTSTHRTGGKAANCSSAVRCLDCDVIVHQQLAHNPGAPATCTTAQRCTVCDGLVKSALGHSPGAAATCTKAQTCTRASCSAVLVQAKGHRTGGKAANCSSAVRCLDCDVIVHQQLAHKPGAAATCTTAQRCTVCSGLIKSALGHKHDDYRPYSSTQHRVYCSRSGCNNNKLEYHGDIVNPGQYCRQCGGLGVNNAPPQPPGGNPFDLITEERIPLASLPPEGEYSDLK